MRYVLLLTLIFTLFISLSFTNNNRPDAQNSISQQPDPAPSTLPGIMAQPDTTAAIGRQLASYALKFVGTPYLYGSMDPQKGFDCSGFVNYVARHFDMDVPRSSVQFTNLGTTIEKAHALPGDIILFTGTNAADRTVGHMGIITTNVNNKIAFVHSSSGKAKGVCTSALEGYYDARFVKIVRILPSDRT